jgi:hypothetical protein
LLPFDVGEVRVGPSLCSSNAGAIAGSAHHFPGLKEVLPPDASDPLHLPICAKCLSRKFLMR